MAINGTVLTVYSWNGVEVGDAGCSSREKKMLLSAIVSIFKVWHVFPGGRRTKNRRCRRVLSVLLFPSAGGQQRPGLGVQTHTHTLSSVFTAGDRSLLLLSSVFFIMLLLVSIRKPTVNNDGNWATSLVLVVERLFLTASSAQR